MAMTSNEPSTGQIPLEACYGFPPLPSALLQVPTSVSAIPIEALDPAASSSSAISPPTTPHAHCLDGDGLHGVEYGSNLADYLAKNPGMKRLYNNHGCIKRPACVSCNESRKKCDLERPCRRCVKQKLPCIERPPRAKRRKIEEGEEAEIPGPKPKPKSQPKLNTKSQPKSQPKPRKKRSSQVNSALYGLPSPVSDTYPGTRVGTPMELDYTPAHGVCVHSPGASCNTTPTPTLGGSSQMSSFNGSANFSLDIATSIRASNSGAALTLDSSLDFLEVPLPDSYLEGISSSYSVVPIYGLDSTDSSIREKFREELERDLQDNWSFDVDLLNSLLGAAGERPNGNEQMQFNLDDDVDTFMSYLPTEQEIKDLLGSKALGFELSSVDDALVDFLANTAGNSSSTAGSFSWGDGWNMG